MALDPVFAEALAETLSRRAKGFMGPPCDNPEHPCLVTNSLLVGARIRGSRKVIDANASDGSVGGTLSWSRSSTACFCCPAAEREWGYVKLFLLFTVDRIRLHFREKAIDRMLDEPKGYYARREAGAEPNRDRFRVRKNDCERHYVDVA